MARHALIDLIPGPISHLLVGSLPFRDPEEALRFLSARPYILPFWPELPLRHPAERVLARGDRALDEGWNGYAREEASALYLLMERWRSGEAPPSVFKVQLLGPISHVLYSTRWPGERRLGTDRAVQGAERQVRWLAEVLRPFGVQLLVMLDEPGFVEWPKLSSGERTELLQALSGVLDTTRALGCFVGVHSCAPFQEALLGLRADLVHCDGRLLLEWVAREARGAALLRAVIDDGVLLVPGVIASVAEDVPEALRASARVEERIRSLVAPGRFLRSATCGHAGSTVEWIEAAYPEAARASS